MFAGDNILTALSVAHECAMVQPEQRLEVVDAKIVDGSLRMNYTVQQVQCINS